MKIPACVMARLCKPGLLRPHCAVPVLVPCYSACLGLVGLQGAGGSEQGPGFC